MLAGVTPCVIVATQDEVSGSLDLGGTLELGGALELVGTLNGARCGAFENLAGSPACVSGLALSAAVMDRSRRANPNQAISPFSLTASANDSGSVIVDRVRRENRFIR